jgi:aminopeptidase
MLPDFESRLRTYAEVMVRVGLNLQRGQRLLITEPYELQGVARSAEIIVRAVQAAARQAGVRQSAGPEVIWGDGPQLREFASRADWSGYARLVAANAAVMQAAIDHGDALLFLQGSQPQLMAGVPADRVNELRRIGGEYFGPIAQQLLAGATNWTAAPAPSAGWADAVYPDLPAASRLAALWELVLTTCRVGPMLPSESAGPALPTSAQASAAAIPAWESHLARLDDLRTILNQARHSILHYVGPGTDLRVTLPPEHRWASARLKTTSGLPFVANLPTEEVFTLPQRDSAEGTVSVSRPVNYGGTTIAGIVLEFRRGRVVRAAARSNLALLEQVLAEDEGAARLGEVALVLHETALAGAGRNFHHPLLDENASSHIALGDAYDFCLSAPNTAAKNRSLIHLDLPITATAALA